ncbi:MAG: hypothetical protein LQ350_008714 [Teloschistes chrysophthalmus]|nr:MAG: hypothetical protein LQ350_008714 [Niorma chrysophthalma]
MCDFAIRDAYSQAADFSVDEDDGEEADLDIDSDTSDADLLELKQELEKLGTKKTRRDLARRIVQILRGEEENRKAGDPEPVAQESETRLESDFPMMCEPTQCLFCLGDPRLPYLQRIHGYAKPNKMMDEVEKHLRKYAPQDILPCPHPQCQAVELTLPNTVTFKNHAAKEHRIFLRAPKT